MLKYIIKLNRKQLSIFIFTFFYFLSILLNTFYYLPWNRAAAYTPVETNNNIVAIFVDSSVYWDAWVKSRIDSYANNYIQQKISDSKALIVPINVSNFKSNDILRILENLYFEWESTKPSSLIWTILIWDIPLPVVNNEGFVYPTIFPYVNFIERKYIYDKNSNFFINNWNNSSTPDIWHSLIRFDNNSDYIDYFDKLFDYASDPTSFVDRKFWFEDFMNLQNFFNWWNADYYINNFIFLEDIAYHRYTFLMYEILQWNYKDNLIDMISSYSDYVSVLEQSEQNQWYDADFLQQYFDQVWDLIWLTSEEEIRSALEERDKIPTLLIKESLESLFKSYNEIFWQTYLSNMRDSLLATSRWEIWELSTHIDKIYLQDQTAPAFLVNTNFIMEEAIDEKVDSEKYYMHIPIPTIYTDEIFLPIETEADWSLYNYGELTPWNSSWDFVVNWEYENFYFWLPASFVQSAEDFSIYRGTFWNYTFSDLSSYNVDNHLSSVWSSYWIFNVQTESNRAYNNNLADDDWDRFEADINVQARSVSRAPNYSQEVNEYVRNAYFNSNSRIEEIDEWASRHFWWASPININIDAIPDYTTMSEEEYYQWFQDNPISYELYPIIYKNAWNPHWDRSIWWSLFDMIWTVDIDEEEVEAYSYIWYNKYSSLVKVREYLTRKRTSRIGDDFLTETKTETYNIQYYWGQDKIRIPYSNVDFFDIYYSNPNTYDQLFVRVNWWNLHQKNGQKYCHLYYIDEETWMNLLCAVEDYQHRHTYNYSTVDTRLYNKSVNQEQLNWMDFTTLDRPINEDRNLTFKWLWWGLVKFEYPDVFDVEVFNESWDKLTLKSKEEINESLLSYLRLKVDEYNFQLQSQLNNKPSFYSSKSAAFDYLQSSDYLATPNRNYNLFDQDYLIDALWEDNISRIVENLYYINVWWSERTKVDNVLENFDQLKEDFDIDKKIEYVIWNHIQEWQSDDPIENPTYASNWYEAWFINSAWTDSMYLNDSDIPDLIRDIMWERSRANNYYDRDSLDNILDQAEQDEQCWIPPDWWVIIFQWPAAFACWLSETLSKPINIQISNSCSLWSFFLDDWWFYDEVTAWWWAWWTWWTWWTGWTGWTNPINLYDSDNWQDRLTSDVNRNEETLSTLTPAQQQTFQRIKNNINIKVLPNNTISLTQISWNNSPYSLEISSTQDIWNISVNLKTIWDNCLSISGNSNSCNSSSFRNLTQWNFNINKYNWEILPLEMKAWTILLEFEICSSDNVCYYDNKIVNIAADKISSIVIDAPTQYVIKWWKMPFAVYAYDQHWNSLSRIFENYNLTVWAWKLDIWWRLYSSTSIDNFWSYYLFDSSELTSAAPDVLISLAIQVKPDEHFNSLNPNLPSWSLDIYLVDADVSINTSLIDYQLSNNINSLYYRDADWIMQLDNSWLLKYEINLNSLYTNSLSSPVIIKTKNWTLLPWLPNTREISSNIWNISKNEFQFRENFIIDDWVLEFYLHPSFISWEDELIISVPWLDDLIVPVNISPSDLYWLDLSIDKQIVDAESTNKWVVVWKDIWWNIIDNNSLTVWINIFWNASWPSTVWLWEEFVINTSKPWWKIYVAATIPWLNMSEYIPDYKTFVTRHTLWYQDWIDLNIMYASLFWTDWWNLWWYFSNYENFVPKVMSDSSKMLAATTMLVDPNSIKKMKYIVQPDLTIINIANNKSNLVVEWWQIYAQILERNKVSWTIRFWSFSEAFDLYKPAPLDSRILVNKLENWVLIVNNEEIFNFNNWDRASDVRLEISSNLDNWRWYWNVIWRNLHIWKLYFKSNGSLDWRVEINSWNIINDMFISASTNNRWWIWVYDVSSNFSQSNWYYSIEDSNDDRLNIWFRNDFSNITSFANWNNVWDATKHFWSDFLINYWDPVLTRIDSNKRIRNTDFDWSIWKKIYSDSTDSIFKVIDIDFDRSWRKDLIVIYKNWTIRLLKNYWWSEPFIDLWDLFVVADWIKDAFVWDVYWDWYEDIIILTNKNKLRVYKNDVSKFDVNWFPICLDVAWWPDSLDWVNQIFFKDMNNNWRLDIVTNDSNWDIKVFYWWNSWWIPNYVSTERFECDPLWRDRLQMELVESYWMYLSNDDVYDESLVHWEWLIILEDDIDLDIVPDFDWVDDFDMSTMFWDWLFDSIKYQMLPLQNFTPIYYDDWNLNYVPYSKILYTWIDSGDPVTVHKNYENLSWWDRLEVWEEVRINITIQANQDTKLTYLENLMWPWIITRNNDFSIVWFNRGDLWDVLIKRHWIWSYTFMIDSIDLSAWDVIEFSYLVKYAWWELVHIDVDNFSDMNDHQDIKAYPWNSCIKWYDFFKSNWSSWFNPWWMFDKEFVDLQAILDDWVREQEQIQEDAMKELEQSILETQESWDLTNFDYYETFEEWSTDNFIWADWQINLELFNWSLADIFWDYESIVDWLCGWYKFSDDSCWLNIPINRAFLAPGYYQDFVCQPSRDDWKPVFRFPATKWKWCKKGPCCVPLSIPNQNRVPWVDNPNAGWLTPCPWVFPSTFRTYISPTLTASVWVAFCFWTYQNWIAVPNPIWNVAWNCVVVAASLPLSCDNDDPDWEFALDDDEKKSDYILQDWQKDLANIWQCFSNHMDVWRQTSPGLLWSSWSFPGSLEWEYLGWIIEFETRPINITLPELYWMDTTEIRWIWWFDLQIEWWDVKWLIQCIIEKRVDNQIRYIINNLTRMTIYVYLPDLSQITEWFEKVNIDHFMNVLNDLNQRVDALTYPWGSWEPIDYMPSQEVYRSLWQTASNPFDAIAMLFREVPLINVETRTINVQVPMISSEELERYMVYLNWRLDRNKAIIEEWQNIWDNVNVVADAYDLINSVEDNIRALNEWKNFPLKLYDWLHIVDRYLTELSCILETFLNWLIWRLEKNAARFEAWVDFIILLIAIMETWQILIDFSVNWRQKCAQCRVDTYDFYSCSLSAYCISLPILPIPPFRLPNIIIDLSHVDLWVDIILPRFEFRPMQLPLLDLPDIPRPPRIDVNIILPSIPVIPLPPELPELPSFLPTIEIDLPLLPPAPKIPNILPAIEVVVTLAEFIWELLCIIKFGIWLVAEWNVKTRIEQLTQRTSRVPRFDSLKLTFPDPPLMWMDIRVDSFVQLRFEFDMIYQFAKALADQINETTNSIAWSVKWIKIDWVWNIPDISVDIDLWAFNYNVETNEEYLMASHQLDNILYYSDDEWLDYDYAYKTLKAWLTYFYEKSFEPDTTKWAWEVLSFLDTKKEVSPNITWIKKLHNDVNNLINNEIKNNLDLIDQISDWDNFLLEISSPSLINNLKDEKFSMWVNLFNWNEEIISRIEEQEHPYYTYLAMNLELTEWMKNALNTNTPSDLWMSYVTYNQAKNYFDTLSSEIRSVVPYFEDVQEGLPLNPLDPSWDADEWVNISESMVWQVDPTAYIKWFFVLWEDWRYHNVIDWTEKWDSIYKNKTYKFVDINNSWKDDIILWDTRNVYIKYAKTWNEPEDFHNEWNPNYYSTLYVSPLLNSPENINSMVDGDWFINIGSDRFKIWSADSVVNNFKRSWQTFDTISFSWDNNNSEASAYLLRLTQRVDVFHEKEHHFSHFPESFLSKKYILVYDRNLDYNSIRIDDRSSDINWQTLRSLVENWTIVQTRWVNINSNSLSISLDNIEKQWKYVEIIPLMRYWAPDTPLLVKSWPWSNQEVWWMQDRADRIAPVLSTTMIRTKDSSINDQWSNLVWYINTTYDFEFAWRDDWQISNMSITYWNNTYTSSWIWDWSHFWNAVEFDYDENKILLKWVFLDSEQNYSYVLRAQDHVWNISNIEVKVSIRIPNIRIQNVFTDWVWSKVSWNLSNDIDYWSVRFEVNRNWVWETITWVYPDVPVDRFWLQNWKDFLWQIFDISNLVWLYDNDVRIWSINLENTQIRINPDYYSDYDIWVHFRDWIPKLFVKNDYNEIFNIHIPIDNIDDVVFKVWWYSLKSLTTSTNCVFDWNDCLLYYDNRSRVVVLEPFNSILRWNYQFDENTGQIKYNIYNWSNENVFDILFTPKGF